MEVRFEKNIITGEEIEVIVKANRLTNNVKSLM
ncbi:LytTR family transcriptional regulator, partial [Lactobacillus salivarius]|nr:LytTR family transcriptional regulator [Ligilactobacillus salivarius]